MTREEYQQLIRERATTLGVDPEYMLRVAQNESNFNPSIGSDTGAKGLFQFMPQTWKSYISKYGAQYGYTADTSPTDPVANTTMAALYTKESTDLHKQKYGRAPSRGELYTYHFLGPTAQSVFGADPAATVDTVLPKIYNSSPTNKAALSNKDGTPLTVAQFLQRMETKAGGKTKMADVPNMLEMPRPTVGDVASPSPFYQDAPPTGQDEFNTRYQEALGFLRSPEWKAAALQMAIAAIQPRVPGQTVFGHLANAVGQGAEAAGRASAIAEEQRRAGVKEQLQQDELGLKRQEVEGRQKLQEGQQKLQEGQLKLQEGQLSIQQATLSRMTEQNQIAWKRLDLDRDRMDKEMARIDAQIKAAEGRERVSLLQNSAKMRTDLIANAQKRLELLHPEKDKVEVDALKGEIARNQSELERLASEYEAARKAITPGGAESTKPTTPVKPTDVPIDDERMLRQARENPELFQKAITEGIPVGGRMLRFKLTEDQKQMLADAPRVIPRPPNNTLGSDIKEGARRVLKALQGSVLGDPEERLVGELKAAPMLKGKPVTPETYKTLSKEEQAMVRQQIETSLPDKENMPKSPEAWKAIFESPLMELAARVLYTDKVVDQIEKDLTDMTPREGKKKAARTRKLDKAFAQ